MLSDALRGVLLAALMMLALLGLFRLPAKRSSKVSMDSG